MKIVYDKNKCIKCGMCVSLCPKYWKTIDGDIVLANSKKIKEKYELEVDSIECIKRASEVCPMSCIYIKN